MSTDQPVAAADHSLNADQLQREKMATLGQLTAGIAHELNNPIGYIASNLNTLRKYADILAQLIDAANTLVAPAHALEWKRRLDETRWNFIRDDLPNLIDETRTGAALLKDVVAELKSLSRANPVQEHATLDSCVRSALNVLSHHFKHHISIDCRLDAALPMPMIRSQVVQLVINLLHNAVQAIGTGRGRLRVTTSQVGNVATIEVDDSGPGVPAELQDRIFASYFTTKSSGTGLGLAIVKHIAEAHGGIATCSNSTALGGARFVVELRTVTAIASDRSR